MRLIGLLVVAAGLLQPSPTPAQWKGFYKDQTRGPDFMQFQVRPTRFEVSSPRHKLNNDPQTWKPVILNLP